MKNILIYLPALFLLFGCEDFLNRAAYDQMDSENFYRNAEEINAAVLACYNGIHGTLNNEFFLTEVRSSPPANVQALYCNSQCYDKPFPNTHY